MQRSFHAETVPQREGGDKDGGCLLAYQRIGEPSQLVGPAVSASKRAYMSPT
jgi:hypothetical protein